MNFIVFDLEATCWVGNHSNKQEIIEIGAVKINEYGEPQSIFSSFVRPIVHPTLSLFCKELTNISQVDVNRADRYPEVIEDFQDWIDIFEEDYLLCSWGNFDKKMLKSNCQLHDMDEEWAMHHINLKAQYHEIHQFRRTIGMNKALDREGFEFTGTPHRGIDDAKNLVKIFLKFFDQWMY